MPLAGPRSICHHMASLGHNESIFCNSVLYALRQCHVSHHSKFCFASSLYQTVGGIVRRKRSRELRFGEFAPESSAFFGVKKLRKWVKVQFRGLELFKRNGALFQEEFYPPNILRPSLTSCRYDCERMAPHSDVIFTFLPT